MYSILMVSYIESLDSYHSLPNSSYMFVVGVPVCEQYTELLLQRYMGSSMLRLFGTKSNSIIIVPIYILSCVLLIPYFV